MAALNTEEENYVRMSFLLTGIAHRAVRAYFDQLFPPVDLASTLNRMYTQLHNLKRFRKVINQTQWNLLFPHNGVPDSKTFDVTLMICLIRHFTSIPQPQYGYDTLPLATELIPAADLVRIKYYRNYLAHIVDGNIDTTYYNSVWTQITDALGRLGGSSVHQECQDLKTKILDQSNQEIMLEVRHLKQSLHTIQKAQKDTIPWNIREQIKQKLETWRETDETFVETRAAVHVLTSLKENSCVTVTGSSGVGKSATVHHVALQMEKDGYELVPITDPCKIVEFCNPEQNTLFIIDDFCGTFSTNQTVLDTLKAKIKDLESILETNKAKVIVTCRHQVYKDERLKAIPLFQSCECDLQSESTCLLPEERQSIATAYLGTDALKINQYMELYEFFPLLCALFKSNTTLEMTEFFKNPFSVYQAEIDKLYTDGAYGKYCCLALSVMFNNNVNEEWFTGEVNKEIQTIIKNTLEACKMMRGTPRLLLKDELDSLIHTFLKNENGIYKTIHDKLFDFLSFYFGTKMIQILIKNASSVFIRERFLYDRMNESDQYKICIPDSYKKMYIERMFNDWQHGKVVDVFCNTNMKVLSFREQFKSYLSSLSVSYQIQLAYKSDVNNNDTVFIQCCFIGDVDLVQWCCSHGVNVDQCRYDRTSPLLAACRNSHVDVVEILVKAGADINLCDSDDESPLYIACKNNHVDVVEILVKAGADIKLCNICGESPLYIACKNNHVDVVEMLLKAGADINLCDGFGLSPLYIACYNNHVDVVEILLKAGADIKLCDICGKSPLYIACFDNNVDVVEILLKAGADINLCNCNGQSPLHFACKYNKVDIVKILLKPGADINLCDNSGQSPLYIACESNNVDVVKILLKAGADINLCDRYGQSPLYVACGNNNVVVVDILVKAGADINLCVSYGQSPLCIACYDYNVVAMLFKAGADINLFVGYGQSPLFIACFYNHAHVVEILLKAGADINLCDSHCQSPLYITCIHNNAYAAELLLERGANCYVCTKTGKSAVDIVKQKGNDEMISLFKKYKKMT